MASKTMNNTSHIPTGYKSSSLGIIPEDWEVKMLGEVCINDGDYGLNAPATDYDENLPTYLRITDIDDDGNFNQSNKKSVNSPLSENYYLKDGDIVFARTGATVGKTYLYDKTDGELVYAGFLIKFTPDKERILPYYLKSQTNTKEYTNWVSITSQRSGQPGINAAEYCSYKFALPSLAEQKRICNLLSLWDTAIAKQTQLIEKLTLRKKGLMQQLLTGKKRLKGFEWDWKEVKLGEICPMERGEMLTSDNYLQGNIPVIAGGKEPAGFHSYANRQKNTITISCSGASAGFVAFHDTPIFATDCFTISESNAYNIWFIYHVLTDLQEKIYMLQTGGAQPHVHPKDVYPMKIHIPIIDEQNAIASVLVNADKEIEIQKQKLEQLQNQKRGLMQVLLTGKRRVK